MEYIHQRFQLSEERCQDLLQGFFLERLLKRELLSKADKERGRFRSFLLQAINHHILDEFKKARTQKRMPEGGWQSLNDLIARGEDIAVEEHHNAFDDAFVKQVIAEAIQDTHAHCMNKHLEDVWEILHARILGPLLEGAVPVPYDRLAEDLGLKNTTEAQNRLATAKRIFQRQFKNILKETTATDDDLTAEIDLLTQFLKKSSKKSDQFS